MGKSRTQTQTTKLDPASQRYVDQMRQIGSGAASGTMNDGSYFTGPQSMSIEDQARPFFNPYMSNVVDATRGEFDHLRGQAGVQANQQATMAGAFGGSRHGVMQGARLGEIDRAQGSTIADLLRGGWESAVQQGTGYAEHQRHLREQQMQEPLFRRQHALQFMNMGMGPTGGTTSMTQPGNLLGDLSGLGMMGMGLFGGGLFGGGGGAMPSPGGAMAYRPGQSGFRL